MHFISSTRQLILESKKDYCLLLQIYKRASYLDPENCRYLQGILRYLQFKKDDGWYTWIEYPVFHQLVSFGILCISSSFDLIEHHSCQTFGYKSSLIFFVHKTNLPQMEHKLGLFSVFNFY